jgi:hypothetical protein
MSLQAAAQHAHAAAQYGHAARHYKEAVAHHQVGHYQQAAQHASAAATCPAAHDRQSSGCWAKAQGRARFGGR